MLLSNTQYSREQIQQWHSGFIVIKALNKWSLYEILINIFKIKERLP